MWIVRPVERSLDFLDDADVLNDTELREALDGLEDTSGATLITPDGEVEYDSAGSEEEGEADEGEASPPVPEDGSEQQGE